MSKSMSLKPRMSEKAYAHSQALNVYVFDLPKSANKAEATKAIEAQFEVKVISINIANQKGKPKNAMQRGRRPTLAHRTDTKKAYVKLKEGDVIPVFAAVEEAEAKAAKIEGAAEEAAQKKAKKEEKK